MRSSNVKFHAIIGAVGVLLASCAANSAPVYVPTTLSSSETCARPVKWGAPKVPQPPELIVPTVNTPIQWQNFGGERLQYGYTPLFAPGPVSPAPNGRPLIRDRNLNLQLLKDDGTWQVVLLFNAANQSLQQQGYSWTSSSSWPGSGLYAAGPDHEQRIVFDQHCHAYTVVNAFRSSLGFAFLLHSRDGGQSWSAYPLPGWTYDGAVRMEVPPSPRHRLARPPVLILHQHPHLANSSSSAVLLFPKKRYDGTLDLGNPVTVANTVCCGTHSGNDTQVVGDGDLVHFAYPRSTPMQDSVTQRWGTPQYVVTLQRESGQVVTGPTLIGIGFNGPANADAGSSTVANTHNQPALAIDSQGYLHAVIGGHGAEMKYRKSLAAHSSASWTAAEYVSLTPDSYTYPSLVLDPSDRPHVISRWSDASYKFKLVHRVRNPITNTWSAQQVLLDPGRSYYGVWYHKLAIDSAGRLFVSYSYYPANLWADEADAFGELWFFTLVKENPACPDFDVSEQNQPGATYCEYTGYSDVSPGVLMSNDNGATFQLTTTSRFFVSGPNPEIHKPLYPTISSILSY